MHLLKYFTLHGLMLTPILLHTCIQRQPILHLALAAKLERQITMQQSYACNNTAPMLVQPAGAAHLLLMSRHHWKWHL